MAPCAPSNKFISWTCCACFLFFCSITSPLSSIPFFFLSNINVADFYLFVCLSDLFVLMNELGSTSVLHITYCRIYKKRYWSKLEKTFLLWYDAYWQHGGTAGSCCSSSPWVPSLCEVSHILPMFTWDSSGFFGFLPLPKHLPVGGLVTFMWCECMCSWHPEMDWC